MGEDGVVESSIQRNSKWAERARKTKKTVARLFRERLKRGYPESQEVVQRREMRSGDDRPS